MTNQNITETATHAPATLVAEAAGKGKRYRVRLLEGPRWGSSGYYTTAALDEAARADVFHDKLKVYLDHPAKSDEADRPERSLRDLVGVLDGNAVRESDGLWGVLKPKPHMEALVESLASDGDLAMSIRASAQVSAGEADGRQGLIINRIMEARSVDLVTEAGAGGRVYELIESARSTVGHEVAERLTRDRRDQVRRAVQNELADRNQDRYAWLEDFDDTTHTAYYNTDDKTWQQTYEVAADDMSVTLTGERTEVRAVTTYHPVVTPAGATTTTQEAVMPQIEEARLAELTETVNRVPALETERDAAIKRAEAAEALVSKNSRDAYTAQVKTAVEAADLPAAARSRVVEALKLAEGADVPDSPAAVVEAAIEFERKYIQSLNPPRKLGFGSTNGASKVTESSYKNAWGRTIPTQEA